MILQVGVKVLLKNKQDKYLLLKRNSKKYPEVLEPWDIVGGRINPGTSLEENLKREVKEETGLELKEKPQLIAAQDILKVRGRHVVRLTYLAKISGEPKLDPDENSEFKWLTLEEIKKLNDLDFYLKQLIRDQIIVS